MAHFKHVWFRRSGIRKLASLLVLITLLVSGLAHPALAANESRVHYKLKADAAAHPNDTFRVVVTRLNKDKNAEAMVAGKNGKKIKDVASDAFVATVLGKDIAGLGADASIKFIAPDAPMVYTGTYDPAKLGTLYTSAANASGLWAPISGNSGITGSGIGVAVVDTGIASGRCDFNNANFNTRISAKVLFNSGLKKTEDGNGHGTHVAGIIAGNSWNCSDSNIKGKYVGIAPEANLINVRVADEDGMSYTSDVVNAIDWVINNRQTYNIRVMNLSLVSSVAESYHTSTLDAIVEKAWLSGIFVVVASGNAGPNTMGYPPANDPFAVTVGAADPMNTAAQSDDTLAPWSSYGVTQDGFSAPDLVAPGRYMTAPLSGNYVTLARQMPDRIVDTNYIWLSGTSMASPVVAGIAALAFQKHPTWTNDQLKWLLIQTATRLGGSTPLVGQGAGEANAATVVNYSGTPSLANQGLLINEQLLGPGGATTYVNGSTASWSSASWSSASWSSASWSSASWSSASWSSTAQWAGATAR